MSILVVNLERLGLTLCDTAMWNEFIYFLSLTFFTVQDILRSSYRISSFPLNSTGRKYSFVASHGDWNSQL